MLCVLDSLYPGLTLKIGRVHTYLGMEIDFTKKGKVSIAMHKYLDNILMEFPEQLGAIATSPAANHLFQVCPDDKEQKLPDPQAVAFHYTTAQLLFLSSRCRQDCQTAVAFLTTHAKAPDEDEWGKLRRVLKYLKGTRRLLITLEADDLTINKWWVAASFQAHDDRKGRTVNMMSLGHGAATSFSRKQKM